MNFKKRCMDRINIERKFSLKFMKVIKTKKQKILFVVVTKLLTLFDKAECGGCSDSTLFL